jgi:nucleotide-binding universal stress UspA family protein
MYQRILVPLDGSELAEVAVPYAEELAGRLGGEIIVLHVCESPEDPNKNTHEVYVERTAGSMEQKGLKAKSALLFGHTAEQIVDFADSEDVGLIVMATHGRSGIRRWVLGNVAAKVIRATDRPVALIRAESGPPEVREEGILRRILVPLDGSKESEVVIPRIEALASQLKSEVVLLHIVAPTYFVYSIPGETVQMPFTPEDMDRFRSKALGYLETVVKALESRGISARAEVAVGSAAEEIISLADEIDADAVAMSTHGRSGISRWAFGSTADKVLHAGNIPLLLVREPRGGK